MGNIKLTPVLTAALGLALGMAIWTLAQKPVEKLFKKIT